MLKHRLPRYICMRDNNQSDCYDDTKKDKTEPFQEQYLPTRYDWRLSNCDERRTCRCKLKDDVKHKFY
jgi:hypothetical protein